MNYERHSNIRTVLISLAITALAALIFAEVTYTGYGESGPRETFGWALFSAAWLGVTVCAFACARVLRASARFAVIVTAGAWPVAVFGAYLAVFASSCAGWGPHTCAFS